MADGQNFNWTAAMVSDLHLKGNEVLLLSVVRAFTIGKKGAGCYYGSISALGNLIGISKPATSDILKKLTERGILLRGTYTLGEQKHIAYKSNEAVISGKESLPTSGKKTLPGELRNFTDIGKKSLPQSVKKVNRNNNKNNNINNNKCVNAHARERYRMTDIEVSRMRHAAELEAAGKQYNEQDL